MRLSRTARRQLAVRCLCAPLIAMMVILTECNDSDCAQPEALARAPVEERADPAQFCEGTLDPEAALTATEFTRFPVIWLGEEFMGYKLTSAGDLFGGDLALAYGSCKRAPGTTSCTPPLVIINRGPDPAIPGSYVGDPFARELAGGASVGSTTLRARGGLVIEVQSNDNIRDEVIEALVIANGDRFGLPEVLPGESLDALNRWMP